MKSSVVLGIFAVVMVGFLGWNIVVQNGSKNEKKPQMSVAPTAGSKALLISLSEVESHNVPEDCWTVVEGKVYDLTEYIAKDQHPPAIKDACGVDGTELFNTRGSKNSPHPQQAVEYLNTLYKGDLEK